MRKILCFFIDQLLCLFHPIILLLRVTTYTIENQMIIEARDVEDEKYSKNLEKVNKLTVYLRLFKKMELNLETIYQMTGKIILLAIVESQTRTTQGIVSQRE